MKETLIQLGWIFIAIVVALLAVTGLILLSKFYSAKAYCGNLIREILELENSPNGSSLVIHKYMELVEKSASFGLLMADFHITDQELVAVVLVVHRKHIIYLKSLLIDNMMVRGLRSHGLENDILKLTNEGDEFERVFMPKPPLPT